MAGRPSSPPVSGAAFLLRAFPALAALGLDEADEVLLAVVVGDLVARRDFPDGADEDLALDDVGLGVRAARVVDVARDVAPGRAVDRPALVELEQVAVVELVGDLVRDAPAPILDDEIALVDGLGRKQAETCLRATDTERATRRNGLHGRKRIAWLANRSGNAPVGSHPSNRKVAPVSTNRNGRPRPPQRFGRHEPRAKINAPAPWPGFPSRRGGSSPPSAPSRTPAPRSGARARARRRILPQAPPA